MNRFDKSQAFQRCHNVHNPGIERLGVTKASDINILISRVPENFENFNTVSALT